MTYNALITSGKLQIHSKESFFSWTGALISDMIVANFELNLQVFGTIVTYIVIVIQFASSEKRCENVVVPNVTQCQQALNNTIQLDLWYSTSRDYETYCVSTHLIKP